MSRHTATSSSLSPAAPGFTPRRQQHSFATMNHTPATATQQLPPQHHELYSWRSFSPHARLVYITDAQTADREIARLRPGPLGFDLEWKPVYRKKQAENRTALVQLANADTILLLHISRMNAFPVNLRAILYDHTVVKMGVGIQYDCKKLYKDFRVNTRGCVDLSLLARSADNARWKGTYTNPIGLSRLCETYEGVMLGKGKVRTSNWESILTPAQQEYAANDSHAALILYNRLSSMAQSMERPPRREYYTFDCVNGQLYQPFVLPWRIWHAYNPFYDPGPPPPKKNQEQSTNEEEGLAVSVQESVSVAASDNIEVRETLGIYIVD